MWKGGRGRAEEGVKCGIGWVEADVERMQHQRQLPRWQQRHYRVQRVHRVHRVHRVCCAPRTDDTSAPEPTNEAKAAKEAKEVKEVKEAKAAIPTEIKNMGALSVLIALLPEVAKHDQHATLLGLLAVCQGAVGIQNRSA